MNTTTTTQRLINRLIFMLMMSAFAATTWATTLTWNGPVGGNWDTATSNWLDGATPATWSNANPDSAIFGSTGVGTINVAESITALALTFNAAGYTLTNNVNLLTLSAGAVITANAAATINNRLSGTGGMVKTGTGALTLGGTASTLSGGTLLRQGILSANHANAMGSTANTLTLGDASTGANALEFKADSGIAASVTLAAISNSNYGISQTITINGGSSLGANAAGLTTTLNLSGTVPVTLRATQTGTGHSTAQDVNWRIEGMGIPAGTTALTLDGTAKALRASQLSGSSPASSFTGDVLIKGTVTTQNRTYSGNNAGNQNLNFTNNDVTVNTGANWSIVWGGETAGALNGTGTITPNCQQALNNIGLTVGNNNRDGSFSGALGGGTWKFAKTGTGTQELSGASITISAGVNLSQGTLKLTKTTGWNSALAVHASNVATLLLNAPLSADSWTFSKQITGGSANAKIEKVGQGTMLLSPAASSSFIGSSTEALTATAGKLYLNSTGFSTAPAVSVAAGATFGGTATAGNISVSNGAILEGGYNNAGTLSAANVTLGSTSTDTVTLKGTLSTTAGYKAYSVNNLTLNGGDQSALLDVSGIGLVSGTSYDVLVSANAITAPNASSVVAALKSNSRAYTPMISNAGKTIQVYYDAAASIYWTGENGTAWDTATGNWRLSGNNAITPFMANDVVFFNDSPSSSTVDISSGDVSPVSTTFNNTTATSYTLQGANGIASGVINKNGNGTVTVANVNATAGTVALNEGALSIAQSGGLGTGALNFNGGALDYAGASTTWSRSIDVSTNNGTLAVANAGTSLTSGGTFSGAGTLTKAGPGTLVLPYTSGTITQPLQIDAGTLTLSYGGGAVTYAGQISGTNGILRLEGTGANRNAGITFVTNNTFTGETHLYGRRIFLDSPTGNAISGDIVVKQGFWPWHDLTLNANEQIADTAVLRFDQSGGDVYEFRLNGKTETVAGLVGLGQWTIIENAGYDNDGANDNNIPPGTLIVTGPGFYTYNSALRDLNGGSNNGSLSFGKSGTGTQELYNAGIAYTGTTTLNGGTLVLQDTTGFVSKEVIMNGGTLELKRTSGSWAYSKPITAGTGAGNLVKSGAGIVTLSGTNTYTGTTTVNAGTLVLQEAPDFASSEIILNGGALELSRTNGTWAYNTAISAGTNTGNFMKSGAGTVVLGGANTYTGTTAVNGGTLLVNGSNSGSGAFSVASGATLGGIGSMGGAATFNTGAKAVFTLTLDPVTKTNTTPLTIAGVMTFNTTEVHVNGPENLKPGNYVLAASGATPSGSLALTPVLDSGSYGPDFSSAAVYLDTVNNALMLSVRPRNTIISFF